MQAEDGQAVVLCDVCKCYGLAVRHLHRIGRQREGCNLQAVVTQGRSGFALLNKRQVGQHLVAQGNL